MASGDSVSVKLSLEELLNARYVNTNHSFQFDSDHFILALLPEYINLAALESYVRKATGVETFATGDWIGHKYMQLGYAERAQIPEVINAALRSMRHEVHEDVPKEKYDVPYVWTYTEVPNIFVNPRQKHCFTTKEGHVYAHELDARLAPDSLQLQTRLLVKYESTEEYSIETSERNYVKRMRKTLEELPDLANINVIPWTVWREENWKTDEGKAFARHLCTLNPNDGAHQWVTEKSQWDAPDGYMYKLAKESGQDERYDYPLVE